VEARMAGAEGSAAAESRTASAAVVVVVFPMDLVVAEFRVGLAGAESRTQWAAVEYLTASAAAEYVSVVRLILAVVRLILRRARAAVCMSAADVSGADLVSVPHHTSVVDTPNQGPHQGQVSTV